MLVIGELTSNLAEARKARKTAQEACDIAERELLRGLKIRATESVIDRPIIAEAVCVLMQGYTEEIECYLLDGDHLQYMKAKLILCQEILQVVNS